MARGKQCRCHRAQSVLRPSLNWEHLYIDLQCQEKQTVNRIYQLCLPNTSSFVVHVLNSAVSQYCFCHCNYILVVECVIFLNMGYWCKFYAVWKCITIQSNFVLLTLTWPLQNHSEFEDVLHLACVLCTFALLSEYKWT